MDFYKLFLFDEYVLTDSVIFLVNSKFPNNTQVIIDTNVILMARYFYVYWWCYCNESALKQKRVKFYSDIPTWGKEFYL